MGMRESMSLVLISHIISSWASRSGPLFFISIGRKFLGSDPAVFFEGFHGFDGGPELAIAKKVMPLDFVQLARDEVAAERIH